MVDIAREMDSDDQHIIEIRCCLSIVLSKRFVSFLITFHVSEDCEDFKKRKRV